MKELEGSPPPHTVATCLYPILAYCKLLPIFSGTLLLVMNQVFVKQ